MNQVRLWGVIVTMCLIMLQQYQIMVKQVLADAGDGSTQAREIQFRPVGYSCGLATDAAKNVTRLFMQKYYYAIWMPLCGQSIFRLMSCPSQVS